MRFSRFFYIHLCGLLCFLLHGLLASNAIAANNAAQLSAADNVVLTAFEAFNKQDLKALSNSRNRVAGHVLQPYVEYWWLNANLTHSASFALTNSDDFRAYLKRYPDTPLTETLRRDWLRLVGRQQNWPLFIGEWPKLNQEDTELTCLSWQQRWQQPMGQTNSHDRSILGEAQSLWVEARPVADACYAVFDILAAEGLLNGPQIWPRLRILLDNNSLNDVKKSAAYLEGGNKALEVALASVNKNPMGYLQREKLHPQSALSVELFLYALNRVARNDAAKAAEWLQKHTNELSPPDAAYGWAQVGLAGAMQHIDDALRWFSQAGNYPMNDTQLGWKARSALRLGDWSQVHNAIVAMSNTEKREPVWRYWLARALAAKSRLGQYAGSDAATALLENLAYENNFYGLLAAEELRINRATAWDGFQPSAAEVESLAGSGSIQRALSLYKLDLKNEAIREWQFAIRAMDDKQLLTAAALAERENIPDRAINTAERTLVLQGFAYRYPIPYRDELSTHAKIFALDEPWVYGLIRQESRFIADVHSRVGASGLMQLMPATAKSIAKKINLANFNGSRITDIKTNIQLGTAYLRSIYDSLGDKVLATAGYNAGPGRAKRWQAEQPLEAAIYIESIPFNETRDYVKKVMANQWFYAQRLGLATTGLKKSLGMVPGKNSAPPVTAMNNPASLEKQNEK